MPPEISFIVPAHNEAFEISRTLTSIFNSANAVGRPFEVVVVNDASTDDTADIARRFGAQVLSVDKRQISAVRNVGGRQAKGSLLFFVDADTQISETLLRAALAALDRGAVGGGAWVAFSEPMGWAVNFTMRVFNFLYMGVMGWAAGCFLYARRDAFYAVGGFDETLYAGEEILLSRALKRRGKFMVLRENARTSNRKLRMYSPLRIIPFALSFAVKGPAMLRQREGLEWWYEGKREK